MHAEETQRSSLVICQKILASIESTRIISMDWNIEDREVQNMISPRENLAHLERRLASVCSAIISRFVWEYSMRQFEADKITQYWNSIVFY